MEQRQRELVLTFKRKLGLWLKLIAPKLVDAIAAAAISSHITYYLLFLPKSV